MSRRRNGKRNITNRVVQSYAPDEPKRRVPDGFSPYTFLPITERATTVLAAIVIVVVGFIIYSAGLMNPFQGDDSSQIISNTLVHSMSHVSQLFRGSTFNYNGGTEELNGTSYRPLMSVAFALIYTLFGPHPLAFHLVQLAFYISSAILFYLVLRFAFGVALSLALALIFLVHPENSQVVYSIPTMQDALFFFFGILAFWLMLRFKSAWSLVLVSLCLFLSLLAKEAGVLFFVAILGYLAAFERRRFWLLAIALAVPAIGYLTLKAGAVGIGVHMDIAPIDQASLGDRLLTMPAIAAFYLGKFIFPWKLATGYYWVYKSFSFEHTALPLLFNLAVVALGLYVGRVIRRRLPTSYFYIYLFSAVWMLVGLVPYLQIVPLDMSACETWFYFSMAGALSLIGVVLVAFQDSVRPQWFYGVVVVLLLTLGIRTTTRAFDYRSQYRLSLSDVQSSPQDYVQYNNLSFYCLNNGLPAEAQKYAQDSINLFPSAFNYADLGAALELEGRYSQAVQALRSGLKYDDNLALIWENLGGVTLVYGTYDNNRQTINEGLDHFPQNSDLWMYGAILEYRHGNITAAQEDIAKSANYGQAPPFIYDSIMNKKQFDLTVTNFAKTTIHVSPGS